MDWRRVRVANQTLKASRSRLPSGTSDPGPVRQTGPTIKILDMGLARIIRRDGESDASGTMTQEGMVMGTLDYIAPEQATNAHSADIRADIYSLGCTFYFLLTGRVPFPGGDAISKLVRHKTEEPRPVTDLRPDVPSVIAAIIRQMMAKEPEQRFEEPSELAETLEQLLANSDDVPTVPQQPTPLAAKRPESVSDDTFEAQQMWVDAVASQAVVHPKKPTPPAERDTPREPISWRRLLIVGGGLLGIIASAIVLVAALSDPESTPPKQPKRDGQSKPPRKIPPSQMNSLAMKFIPVPKGTFWMSDGGKNAAKQIEITHDFQIGVYEVTQSQWQTVMGKNKSSFSSTGSFKERVAGVSGADLKEFPIENVSWNDVQEFIKKLNQSEKATGWLYRLPTATEWEYACRGAAVSKAECSCDYYFAKPSNTLSVADANFHVTTGQGYLGRTTKVGSYPANALGLYDMHENVYEWCRDAVGSERIYRGGGWLSGASICRAGFTNRLAAFTRSYDVGFRLVRVPIGNQ